MVRSVIYKLFDRLRENIYNNSVQVVQCVNLTE